MDIAEICQKFNKAEAFSYVRGRPKGNRQAMAIVISEDGDSEPKLEEFDITNAERSEVERLAKSLRIALAQNGSKSRNIILAAIAELARDNIEDNNEFIIENSNTDKQEVA